jgi:hypothetical protein
MELFSKEKLDGKCYKCGRKAKVEHALSLVDCRGTPWNHNLTYVCMNSDCREEREKESAERMNLARLAKKYDFTLVKE